jgi:hypothetical protein
MVARERQDHAMYGRQSGPMTGPVMLTPASQHRDGMLLLISALALGMLAIASLTLLRLLARLHGE